MAEQNIKNNAWGDWDQAEVQDTPRMMSVDIFEVDTSHVNPRQTRGENYDSTRESIRNIGLQSILTITRVPGQQRYSLSFHCPLHRSGTVLPYRRCRRTGQSWCPHRRRWSPTGNRYPARLDKQFHGMRDSWSHILSAFRFKSRQDEIDPAIKYPRAVRRGIHRSARSLCQLRCGLLT